MSETLRLTSIGRFTVSGPYSYCGAQRPIPRGHTYGDEIVARLDDTVLAMLGGPSKIIRLSCRTADEQAIRHPDLVCRDCDILQELVDRGTIVQEGERTEVFVAEISDGKCWRAVVKRTADRRKTFPVTFHRIKQNQVGAARRRGGALWIKRVSGARRCPRSPHAAVATSLGLGSGASWTIYDTAIESQRIATNNR